MKKVPNGGILREESKKNRGKERRKGEIDSACDAYKMQLGGEQNGEQDGEQDYAIFAQSEGQNGLQATAARG